jgi:hypothetical protein
LFGSLFDSMFAELLASACHALCRKKLGGRQPVGRGVGGRIVVPRPDDTIRCGADIDSCVCVRMIRVLITRILTHVYASFASSADYS